jgi:hypothetical protein
MALVYLCLYWIVESDPRHVFGSFRYECLLVSPLLTPSTMAELYVGWILYGLNYGLNCILCIGEKSWAELY